VTPVPFEQVFPRLVAGERVLLARDTGDLRVFKQLHIERTRSTAMPATGARRRRRSTQDRQVSTRCRRLGSSQPSGLRRLSNPAPGSEGFCCTGNAECHPCRQRLADLPSPLGELGEHPNRGALVAAVLADEGNAGGLAAGVDLDADRLRLAADLVLEADRERTALVHDRPATTKQPMCAVQRTRHQRFLVLVQNEDFQLRYSKLALTGRSTRTRRRSPRQCCRPAFERSPFRA
jgi:hypothetical protein